jgi:hypothetical protein
MNTMSKLTIALVGAAGLALATEATHAAVTVVVNGTGSSAGRQFAGLAPLFVCDTSPTPQYFAGPGSPPNLTEWQCKRGGVDHIFRYTSGASADGYEKQPNGSIGTVSVLNTASGCTAGTLDTNFKGTGLSVIPNTCSGAVLASQPVHFGGADVKASSLHQTLFGSTQTPPAKGHLTTTPVVVVPFAVVVGADVRGKTSAGAATTLLTLQEEEIRQILAGIVTDWTQLGYTTVNGTPSNITVCQRTIGSGTLATIDEVIMRPKYWTGSFFDDTTNGAVPNQGSGNMQACLGNNKNSIGYLDSDSVKGISPAGAYQVGINGYQVNTSAVENPPATPPNGVARLKDLRCGRYIYWADWNFINRTASVEGAPVSAVAGTQAALVALRASMLAHNPLPDFWLSENDSFAQKGDDRGPISWVDVSNNGENLVDVCRYAGSTF